jgi:hypothetical protein
MEERTSVKVVQSSELSCTEKCIGLSQTLLGRNRGYWEARIRVLEE